MSSILLMSGQQGKRTALPNASIHIHQPLGSCQGQASDMLIHAERCERFYEEFERTVDRDCFMSAEEALEWGLIDHILKARGDKCNG